MSCSFSRHFLLILTTRTKTTENPAEKSVQFRFNDNFARECMQCFTIQSRISNVVYVYLNNLLLFSNWMENILCVCLKRLRGREKTKIDRPGMLPVGNRISNVLVRSIVGNRISNVLVRSIGLVKFCSGGL